MVWVDFGICFLFGMFGVHKFREKKKGMGFLYLFTFGLFGFGWIFDSIKYLLIAIEHHKASNLTEVQYDNVPIKYVENEVVEDEENRIITVVKTIGLWILTIFFAVLALGFIPSWGALFALIGAALAIPISKWQGWLGKYVKGKIKTIALVVLAVLTLVAAPKNTDNKENIPEPTLTAIVETTAATQETTMPTEQVTEPATEAPTEAPTTPPTEAKVVAETEPQQSVAQTEATNAPTSTEEATPEPEYTPAPSEATPPPTEYVPEVTEAEEEMVWISGSGQRYHSNPECSGMKSPSLVPISQVGSRTPCNNCY